MCEVLEHDVDRYLANPEMAATAAHLCNIERKLAVLKQAKDDAWAQMLTVASRAYGTGQLSAVDIEDLLSEMGIAYGSGFTLVWDEHMPVKANRARHLAERQRQNLPNGPNGSWTGPMHLGGHARPNDGIAVVYVLFDAANLPIYVGSSGRFGARIEAHRRGKPQAVRWVAYGCRNREHAYELEDQLIKQHKLRLNKRNGR
jgi:predicted GIY-YIG superfamily endonuclease